MILLEKQNVSVIHSFFFEKLAQKYIKIKLCNDLASRIRLFVWYISLNLNIRRRCLTLGRRIFDDVAKKEWQRCLKQICETRLQ